MKIIRYNMKTAQYEEIKVYYYVFDYETNSVVEFLETKKEAEEHAKQYKDAEVYNVNNLNK
jgi:hypothetical protein